MRTRKPLACLALALLAGIGLTAAVPAETAPATWFRMQFSATVTQPDPVNPGRILKGTLYVGAARLRWERPEPAHVVLIYDRTQDVTWIADIKQRTFQEIKGPGGGIPAFLPLPRGNPCAGAPRDRVTCRILGDEPVGGRRAVKWEMVLKAGDRAYKSYAWIDRDLLIQLRLRSGEGQILELQSLRLGPQPPELFNIPGGFRKVGR